MGKRTRKNEIAFATCQWLFHKHREVCHCIFQQPFSPLIVHNCIEYKYLVDIGQFGNFFFLQF